METRRTITDDRAAQFLSRIEAARNLPSLPQVLLKLIEACRNKEMTIRDIAQIVSGDSALSARILRIARDAPFYRRAEKIVRMDDALFRSGATPCAASPSAPPSTRSSPGSTVSPFST